MWLKQRELELVEEMDKPDCDPDKLFRTYHQFTRINRLLSRWGTLFQQHISTLRPASGAPLTILDIGCGGGDICRYIHRLANQESLPVEITGIDTDSRAIAYARSQKNPPSVRFLKADSGEMVRNGRQFHMVISNHLLHHLSDRELRLLFRQSDRLATELILFNDIRRSVTGLLIFSLTAPLLFRRSYIAEDGISSIRRSFRPAELRKLLPAGWEVQTLFPFRLLLMRPGWVRPVQPEPVQPGMNRAHNHDSESGPYPRISPGEGHE